MACNECNKPCLDNQAPKCSCPIKLGTICVLYDGEPLGNLDVVAGENMQDILVKIDALISHSNLHKNIGEGAGVFKQINLLNQVELKSLISSDGTLDISELENEIDIKLTSSLSDFPRYIVNNLYNGDEELGTIGKPYKTIQNAIDAFVGGGTKNSPENENATIVVQKGNTYTFTGNFSYRNLNVIIEEGAVVNHTPPAGGFLIDYDELTDIKSTGSLIVKDGARLNLSQKGIRNKGSLGGASQVKTIKISGGSGDGEIRLTGSKQSGYALIEANYQNESGYGMPAFPSITFDSIKITSSEKDVWNVGREAEVTFRNCKIRHSFKGSTIDIASESFSQVGGNITLYNCELHIGGGARTNCFTLQKEASFGCNLTIEGGKLVFPDTITNFFFRYGTENPTVDCRYFSTTSNIPLSYIFYTSSGIWSSGALFKYNIFDGGEIAFDSGGGIFGTDLTNGNTVSSSNIIGGRNVATLVKYPTRANAAINLTTGSMFINTNSGDVDSDTWFLDIVI